MKQKLIILSLALMMYCGTMTAAAKHRLRATFDQGWTFRLCKTHADASEVIKSLGIANPGLTTQAATTQKNKVTDDTEPEQAQVTASESPHPKRRSNIATRLSALLPFPTTGASNYHSTRK
mgnify:CR=1 FL=1